MDFTSAKKKLREGVHLCREAWCDGAYIKAENPDPDQYLTLIDQSGRPYGVSAADTQANDWLVINIEGETYAST